MKRKYIAWIITVFVFCATFTTACTSWSSPHIKYITDIEQYKVPETGIWFFPESIPQNATVIFYCEYACDDDYQERYLELCFDTQIELLQYVAERKTWVEQKQPPKYCDTSWITVQNIYDPTYFDVIDVLSTFSTKNDAIPICVAGYELRQGGWFANFHAMTYSLEDLTVIHTYMIGRISKDNYIPQYFVRFSVPYQDSHEWIIPIGPRKDPDQFLASVFR
jgi:hypothetical protein